jgi:small subunit ribosomal protein S9
VTETGENNETTGKNAEAKAAPEAPAGAEAPAAAETTTETAETPAAPAAAETTAAPEVPETAAAAEAPAAAAPTRPPVVLDRPIQTVGRRKEAVVRVRLVPGTGKFDLDGRTLEAYFPNKVHQQLIKAPLVTVDRVDSVDIYAHLDGGGPSGQAGALRLGIARALILVQPEDRPALKKAGFLTRDPRATERKKYGLKKARKAPQYSKR